MKTNKHQKVAGALQAVQGLMMIIFGSLYVILYIHDLQEGSQALDDRMLILALILFVGVVQLCFGTALALQKQWTTRAGGFICCLPSLTLGFPPVIVGAYTIWTLVQTKNKI